MNTLPDRRNLTWLVIGSTAYVAVVFAVDLTLPSSIDVWVLYLPLLLWLTWLDVPKLIVVTAVACTILVAVDILFTEREPNAALTLVILGTRLVALWVVALSGIVIVHSIRRRKQLEREVLEIAGNEQQRIGQELHDSVGQELTGLGLMVNALGDRLSRSAEEFQIIDRLQTGVIRIQEHIRTLSHGLVPVPVEAEGLCTALDDLASDTTDKSGILVQFSSDGAPAIPDHATATHLYRIAQEAVNNALRHAGPHHITLCLRDNGTDVSLIVEDDGMGIQYPLDERKGMGLRIMHYRAEQIGGQLGVRWRRSGGTVVTCVLKSNSNSKELPNERPSIAVVKSEDINS
jgi:signal transduction histidine kinase